MQQTHSTVFDHSRRTTPAPWQPEYGPFHSGPVTSSSLQVVNQATPEMLVKSQNVAYGTAIKQIEVLEARLGTLK